MRGTDLGGRYLAQEQRFVLRGDRSELNHIKEDLDALRSSQPQQPQPAQQRVPAPAPAPAPAAAPAPALALAPRGRGTTLGPAAGGASPDGQGATRHPTRRGRPPVQSEYYPDDDDEEEEEEDDEDDDGERRRGGGDEDDDEFTLTDDDDDDGGGGGQGNLSALAPEDTSNNTATDLSGASSGTDASVELQRLLRERRVSVVSVCVVSE
jgi:hypothetical protein